MFCAILLRFQQCGDASARIQRSDLLGFIKTTKEKFRFNFHAIWVEAKRKQFQDKLYAEV